MTPSRLAWISLTLTLGATVVSAQEPVRSFSVVDTKASLYMNGYYTRNEQDTVGASSDERQALLGAGVEIDAVGYAYHPNLFDWRAGVALGAAREWLKINDDDFNTTETLVGYDLSGLFLKERPVSLMVFASQFQSLRDRDFGRTIKVDTRRYGLTLYTKGKFPTSLLLERLETDEDGDQIEEDITNDHLRFWIADHRDPDWLTEVTYDHFNIDTDSTFTSVSGGPPVTQNTHDLIDDIRARNVWRFGPSELKHSLAGFVRALDRRDFFPNRAYTVQQQLDLYHSQTFSTYYRGRYFSDDTDQQDQTDYAVEIGLRKSFYDSLDIRANVVGEFQDFDNRTNDTIGSFFNADYRKITPIGLYSSSLLLGLQYEQQRADDVTGLFQDDPITLTGFVFSPLARPDIDVNTISVTDSTNTRFYVENTDYIIRVTGLITEIARIPGSNIADGQTVLVDYRARTSPDSDIITTHFSWAHRMDLDDYPVALYASYRLRDETLESGDDPGNLEKLRTLLLGTEIDWENLTVISEFEWRDQELSPSYVAQRIRADYLLGMGRDSTLGAGVHEEYLQYESGAFEGQGDISDYMTTYGGYVAFTTKVGRNAIMRVETDYLNISGREERELLSNRVGMEWQYGKLDVSVEGRYNTYDLEGNSGSTAGVAFYVKREF